MNWIRRLKNINLIEKQWKSMRRAHYSVCVCVVSGMCFVQAEWIKSVSQSCVCVCVRED